MIGLVTGGRSRERDRSLLSAGALEDLGLAYARLDPSDTDFAARVRRVGVAFLAIAGQWAEDGKLQGLPDTLGIPYTGSGGARQRGGDAQAHRRDAGMLRRRPPARDVLPRAMSAERS
jgi:D-alanine-D-alanine ligase-like ATP-grasp enzyme